jgi:hypothetical protein
MSETQPAGKQQAVPKGLLLFIFALAYLYLFARILWRIGDEGMLVYGAQMVTQGALPYRDFFEVMGPGSFYWLALFFQVFGTTIAVARGLLVVTAAVVILLIYWMTRRVYRGPFELLPSLLFLAIGVPLWAGTSHHWDAIFFGLLAVAAFFLWQDRKRTWFLALAGALAGVTSCFMQPKGLYLVLALLLAVWINARRAGAAASRTWAHLGILLGSYAAVGGVVLLCFAVAGGLHDLIDANLLWPLQNYSNLNVCPYGYGLMEVLFPSYVKVLDYLLPFPVNRIAGGLILVPFALVYCLPVLLVGLTGVWCRRRENRSRIFSAVLLPYWTADLALWVSELHRKDFMHLIYGAPLQLILFMVIWHYNFAAKKMLNAVGLGLLSLSVLAFGALNGLLAASASEIITTRRGAVYAFKQDPALNFLIKHTKPGDYVFVYQYYPMYYFLADVKNPTRYFTLVSNFHTDAQFYEAIASLEQKKVKYVLWDTLVAGDNIKIWFPQYSTATEANLRLEQYLQEHYQVIGLENGFRILRRRDLPAD